MNDWSPPSCSEKASGVSGESAVKSKACASPGGSVTFSTMMLPRLAFLNVQTTVAFAGTMTSTLGPKPP